MVAAITLLLCGCSMSTFTCKQLITETQAHTHTHTHTFLHRLYSPSAYHVAKSLVMLPFAAVNVVAFCGTVYGMTGLRQDLQGLPVVQHMVIALLAYLLAQQVGSMWERGVQDC